MLYRDVEAFAMDSGFVRSSLVDHAGRGDFRRLENRSVCLQVPLFCMACQNILRRERDFGVPLVRLKEPQRSPSWKSRADDSWAAWELHLRRDGLQG